MTDENEIAWGTKKGEETVTEGRLIWTCLQTEGAGTPAVPATIGESFSWTTENGEIQEILGVDADGFFILAPKGLTEEQKKRWARILDQSQPEDDGR